MNSQTSLVVKSCSLQQWAIQINKCKNGPKTITVAEWSEKQFIIKAAYYYRLKCVRQAYLDSVEPPLTEIAEMPVLNETENNRGKSSIPVVLSINQGFSIDLLDNVSATFIKNLLGVINHASMMRLALRKYILL